MIGQMTNKQSILRARAAAVAREAPSPPSPDGQIELIEFALGMERYAIRRDFVKEVHPLRDLTPLPGAPSHIAGVVNIRSQVIAVLALKALFGIPDKRAPMARFCLVVDADGARFGIATDGTVGLRVVQKDTIEETLPTLSKVHSEYVSGITQDHIVILDPIRLINSPGILVDHEPADSAGARFGEAGQRSQ